MPEKEPDADSLKRIREELGEEGDFDSSESYSGNADLNVQELEQIRAELGAGEAEEDPFATVLREEPGGRESKKLKEIEDGIADKIRKLREKTYIVNP